MAIVTSHHSYTHTSKQIPESRLFYYVRNHCPVNIAMLTCPVKHIFDALIVTITNYLEWLKITMLGENVFNSVRTPSSEHSRQCSKRHQPRS